MTNRLALTTALCLALAAASARAESLRFIEVQSNVPGVTALGGARGVAVSPDGRHVYAVAKLDDAINVFTSDTATGQLSFVESHTHTSADDGLRGATAVTLSPDGKHVYLGSFIDDALVVFSRDADTGALTFVQMKRDGSGGINHRVNGLDGVE